ncbi:ADP-ribosylglycohydrolase family protein [Methylobacterium sp. P31]
MKLSLPPLGRTQPLTRSPATSPAIFGRASRALLGLAVGDALGTTLEFSERDNQTPHTETTGGVPFDLEPCQWNDETAMLLALADSLINFQRFDLHPRGRRSPADALHRTGRPQMCGPAAPGCALRAPGLPGAFRRM